MTSSPSSTAEAGSPDRRRRAFYGRQAGRPLRAGARALLETLLPRIAIELPPPEETLNLGALFGPVDPAQDRPVWLEIGFGAGEHLAWQAERQPGAGLIGAEVFTQGMARMLRRVKDAGLQNVRLYRGDGRDLLAALAPGTLARVFILFPDPWPKKRHRKRRIVDGEILDSLAGAMRDGAELRLATDHIDYAAWMLERLAAHPDFEWLARGPADWRNRPDDWPPTRYEAKALAQGRRPVYLRYRRRPRQR
jgi:tRNA (guanine-N7-)-methyltransferase